MAEPAAAAAVVSIATVAIFQLWQNTAPPLAELRLTTHDRTDPTNYAMRQRLLDADFTVGSLAGIVGLGMLAYSREWKILLLMGVSFTVLSGWYHSVLNSTPPN